MARCKSSFNGKLDEIPGVYVDNFENPYDDGAKAYFLSHYHSDHTVGLGTYKLLNKLRHQNNVFIYASQLTGAIIKYNWKDLQAYVKILKIGSNLIALPGDQETHQPEICLNVKLIPAGHCLGSVMFLFETTSQKVLYTGDFRIRPNDIPNYSALLDKEGRAIKLDALYLDTTFIDKEYENFPKRTDSVQEAIDKIDNLLESDLDVYVVLETPAHYGYEYLFNQIYKSLKMKVSVDNNRWEFYRTVPDLVPGVTDGNDTRIILKGKNTHWYLNKKKCITIRFSALKWTFWDEEKSSTDDSGNKLSVCFSTHCSRTELTSFVNYLDPVRVVGFPNPYNLYSQSKCTESDDKGTSDGDAEKISVTPKKTPMRRSCQTPEEFRNPRDKKVSETLLKKLFCEDI